MTDGGVRFSRRALLAAGGVSVVAGAAARATSLANAAPATAEVKLQPVSMAMHIHGPFSEGIASFGAHLDQARRNDVDVIWWTDHDFRVAAHDHRQAVHFDGASEPEDTLAWDWVESIEGALASSSVEFVDGTHSPDDPPRALRLTATGGEAAGGTLWYAGTAWNSTYSTCIADTTLDIDVLPEQVGPDAAFVMQLDLSYHPAKGGRPAGTYVLRYRIGAATQRRHTADGLIGTVDVPAPAGNWKRFTLRLADDIRKLWPDLVAEDNSLCKLKVGVTAAAGSAARVVVDRLQFHRTRRQGQQGEDLRKDVLAAYRNYPGVTHHRAYEISLVRHLNWYGGDQTLPAFPSPPKRDNDPALAEAMVKFLHEHGGVVCWNHPMDVVTREALATLMIERNNIGADLVEIGRDPLLDLLWVFDVAARNAVFFTAVGASDDHDGTDWLATPERWITTSWASSTGQPQLVDALRRGRAWFADIALYRGALDLRLGKDTAMGGVLITRESTVPVELMATDLPAGSSLEVVTGRADLAGTADLRPATTTQTVALTNDRHRLSVSVGTGTYVRTQVKRSDGTVLAVSNPLWLLRNEPPRGVPASRRLR